MLVADFAAVFLVIFVLDICLMKQLTNANTKSIKPYEKVNQADIQTLRI